VKCSWSASELILHLDNQVSDDLIMHLNGCNPFHKGETIADLRTHIDNEDSFSIYPATSNLFICDDQFIQSCTNPISLFKYYEKKIGNGKTPISVSKHDDIFDVDSLPYSDDSRQTYQELLDTVILDVGSLKKASISTPPDIFYCLSNHKGSSNPFCRFLSEFLSLMAISDRVIASDENLNYFEFQIFTKDNVKKFRFTWLDIMSMNNNFWYSCYKWISSDEQKSVDIKLKRHIVREAIAKYYTDDSVKSFDEGKESELIQIFDNILRLIVSGRTQEYFETQKTLKAEYIDNYSKNFDSFSNVVNAILALIVALVAGMYGVLFAQGEVFDVFSPNKSVGILLILMLVAEIFVLISSIAKFISHHSYIVNLRKINSEKLMISDADQEYLKNNKSGLVTFVYIVLTLIIALTVGGIYWFMR